MAYTYDDFLKAASGTNLLGRFSQDELEITKTNPEYGLSMLSLMKDQDSASTPEAKLLVGEAMNLLRSNYSVASPGSTDTRSQLAEYGSFKYDKEDEYQQLLKNIANPTPFQYDREEDPAWDAYKKAYLREGERATGNALARASAATGGVPSSYAITAAQQAGANYGEQLAGMVPALEQQAYERYLNDQNLKQKALQALEADRADAYDKYLDGYQMLLDKIRQESEQQPSTGNGTQGVVGGSENSSGLTDGDMDYLKTTYPTGKITSKNVWDELIALYGEPALTAAGYSFGDSPVEPGSDTPNATDAPDNTDSSAADWKSLIFDIIYKGGSDQLTTDNNTVIPDNNANQPDAAEEPVVDEQSIMDLGFGPIGDVELDRLIQDGIVEMYIENGVIKFRRKKTSGKINAPGSALGRVGLIP